MNRVIAFYLPQFHPTPENDEWWGKGFTEWTNVAKAKPLFKGHKQPHIPADLGFYDLRLPEARAAQAALASKYGIEGFCYWHYWFGKGKKLLNFPFEEVVRLKEPDFPFCLAWANHSWYNKLWSSTSSGIVSLTKSKLLIEQEYQGIEDYKAHFYDLIEAFKDKRYLKIWGKLVFVIFSPEDFKDFPLFKKVWDDLCTKEGLPGFYFIAHVMEEKDNYDSYLSLGYSAVNLSLHRKPFASVKRKSRLLQHLQAHVTAGPEIVDYNKAIDMMDSYQYEIPKVYPTIIPNWDHTPRSGRFGRLFNNCTPALFSKHVQKTFDRIKEKEDEDKVVFLKSWNEWGEGNYIEPDLEYGTGFLEALSAEV